MAALPPPAYPLQPGAYPQDLGITADVNIVVAANTTLIPQWNARLAHALGRETPLILDFNLLCAGATDVPQRIKIVTNLVSRATGVVMETKPAVEQLVRAIEKSCLDAVVKSEVVAKITAIRFATLSGEPAENKSLQIVNNELIYSGNFMLGAEGILSEQRVRTFFEQEFYARERLIVTKFIQEILPDAQKRIQTAIQNPNFVLEFDVIGILGECSKQNERLPTAEYIVSRQGTAKVATSLVSKAAIGFNNTAAAIERGLMKENHQIKVEDNVDTSGEDFTSPNILAPLVKTIEFLCQNCQTNVDVLQKSLSKIKFVSSSQPKALILTQDAEKIVPVMPVNGVPTAIQSADVVYQANFEARNMYGAHTSVDIIKFLEAHFRCQEQKLVMGLLQTNLPKFNLRMRSIMGPEAQIEIIWASLFHETYAPSVRVEVATAVCARDSIHLLQPLIAALERVNEQAPQLLTQRVSKIAIQGVWGKFAKPYFQWGPSSDGPDSPAVLIYYVGIDRLVHGFYNLTEAKENLRAMFGLETPSGEDGLMGALNKVSDDINKINYDVTDKLSKAWNDFQSPFSFGTKKK